MFSVERLAVGKRRGYEKYIIKYENGRYDFYLRRPIEGPMPFDRADSSGFSLVHCTGYEYWDKGLGKWMPEYEDDTIYDEIRAMK